MEYAASIFILIALFVILAVSFNLILGYSGLMSIAHPIFFGLGAYSSSLLVMYFHVPVILGIVFGIFVAFVFSIALSLPSLRVSGDYLVIASIGFQLGLLQIIRNLDWTGGAGGVTGITPLFDTIGLTSTFSYAAIVAVAAAASVWSVRWIVSGDYGRAISAMRDDEDAFKALGRNPVTMKIVLFGIGSAFAGLAGGLYAHYFLFISPDQFDLLYSAMILTMVVVGGVGTVMGPVVGAILLEVLPQAFSFLRLPAAITGPMQGIMFTGLVLVFLFFKPGGIVGNREAKLKLTDDAEDDTHNTPPTDSLVQRR
jgi:branched-chain amino acid transport system permease protein